MRRLVAALAAIGLLCAPHAASAQGGRPLARAMAAKAPNAPSLILDEAARHLGQGNFTGKPGPWCAWFVSAILRATGRAPLLNGLAASALRYGPIELRPRPGDLAVMRNHVGFVVADLGADVEIISGNWGRRVALARISKSAIAAFVKI